MTKQNVQNVVMLDPSGRINWNSPAVIKRHDKYAQELFVESDRLRKLVILTRKSDCPAFFTQSVEIINIFGKKRSLIANFWQVILWSFTHSPKPNLLIASDPWNSFIHVKVMFWALKIQGHVANIQTQIHFEPNSIRSKNLVDRKVRIFFLKRAIIDSISIRCVSKSQASQILEICPASESKLFIAPVPLNIQKGEYECFKTNRPRVIGFLGRIHQERGLEKFLKVARDLSQRDKSVKYLIAGTGPNEKDFLAELRNIAGGKNVRHLGEVNNDLIVEFWSQVGVLLSTAEFESYGRSVRESLYYGVPVLAFQSAGTYDLEEQNYPYFRSILRSDSDEEILKIIDKYFSIVTDEDFKKKYEEEMSAGMSQMIENWITHS